jgi:predicted RNA binding protein YcfA (HicA-like mRNA interferase family)
VAGGAGRYFQSRQGLTLRVELKGKTLILPMHAKELKKGLVEGIKKQLGLK